MKRRDFIKSAAIGTAALSIVPISFAVGSSKGFKKDETYKIYSSNIPSGHKPVYPEVAEYIEKGLRGHPAWAGVGDGKDRDKYHLLSYVPNIHKKGGYTLCRRTYVFSHPNNVTNEHIKIKEMKYFREECESMLKNPKNYVYIKNL